MALQQGKQKRREDHKGSEANKPCDNFARHDPCTQLVILKKEGTNV